MNYFYKLRFSLYATFGLIPSTDIIENRRKKASDELGRLEGIAASDKLKRYKKLDDFVNSNEFKERKKNIQAQKYKGTEAFYKERRFNKLKRSSGIKTYYKVRDSQDLKFYDDFSQSDKLAKYKKAHAYFNSPKFKEDKKQINNQREEQLKNLKKKKQDYKKLKSKYNWYYKLVNKAGFKDFLHFKDSDTFQQYLTLEKEVQNYSLNEVKARYKKREKELKQEKKHLEKRYKQLEKEARQANKKKEPFKNEQELERIKETLAKGTYDQKIKDADYKQAIEYIKIQQYRDLRKRKRVRQAAAYYHSAKYRRYLEVVDSNELKQLEELKDYFGESYAADLQKARQANFKNSQLKKEYDEYKKLKTDQEIKRCLKFEKSKRYKTYRELHDSKLIKEYEDLYEYVHSDAFIKYKTYMKNPKKFKLSDEYKQLQEYKELRKDDEIKWYYKKRDDKHLNELKKWEITFDDDFDSNSLDTSKWDLLPYPAKKFISGTYSQWNDEQLYTEDSNYSISNSVMKLETRQENREGKAWHPTMGFIPKSFKYTSSLLNTGESFRQQYGIFEAKMRPGYAFPLTHSFHLSSGFKAPAISVVDYGEKKGSRKALAGAFTKSDEKGNLSGSRSTISGKNLGGQYHLFTLEWGESALIWKINGITVRKQTTDLPDKPLFLSFFPSVKKEIDSNRFPVSMDIDWVKVYKRKQPETD